MTHEHTQASEVSERIACSLPSADLHARLKEWGDLRRAALIVESTEGNVNTSIWERRDDVATRLKSLVDAERHCCSFLAFHLQETDDEIRLETTFPPGAKGMFILDSD